MFEQALAQVKIVEVGPRDGLQNEKCVLATSDKLTFIHKLLHSGISNIEVGSFVRPEKLPQMADSQQLFSRLAQSPGFREECFPVLIPNLQGLENAMAVGARNFSLLTTTSESFAKKNLNATVEQSLQRIAQIVERVGSLQCRLRCYISTAFGCPYEGVIESGRVVALVEKLLALGIAEISLGDTIGAATPRQVDHLLREVQQVTELNSLALHFHDTHSMAMANILVGLEHGVGIYDSSAGGLGGCPYAPGATGNVATEDVVYLLDSLGVKSGIDLGRLVQATDFILQQVGRTSSSKVYQYYQSKRDVSG